MNPPTQRILRILRILRTTKDYRLMGLEVVKFITCSTTEDDKTIIQRGTRDSKFLVLMIN